LSKQAALIEFIEHSHSIDSLKKIYKEKNLGEIYKIMFKNNYEEA